MFDGHLILEQFSDFKSNCELYVAYIPNFECLSINRNASTFEFWNTEDGIYSYAYKICEEYF